VDVAKLCKEHGAWLHVDAGEWCGVLLLSNVDLDLNPDSDSDSDSDSNSSRRCRAAPAWTDSSAAERRAS
jgi:cysteine sulfinate desulfinase/cysteine desulfurase-like protein